MAVSGLMPVITAVPAVCARVISAGAMLIFR